ACGRAGAERSDEALGPLQQTLDELTRQAFEGDEMPQPAVGAQLLCHFKLSPLSPASQRSRMTAAAALSTSSRRIRRRPPSARRVLSAVPASREDQRSSTMLTGSLKRRSSSLAKRRAAGASAPGVPSTLYGAPTMRRRGLSASTSRAIAVQSGPARVVVAAGRGAAVAVSVSPAAMPIRLSPKSKARIASTGLSGMPGDQAQPVDIDAEEPPRADPALFIGQLEHHARIDRHGGPGVVADLALELAGLPARVAECDEGAGRTFTTSHRGE